MNLVELVSVNMINFFQDKKELKFLNQLAQSFPINDSHCYFYQFLFSNEVGFLDVVEKLGTTQKKATPQKKVALLVGESNLLSLLPELANIADIIVTADIESRLLTNIRILLDCLKQSNSPKEFVELYEQLIPEEFKDYLFDPAIAVQRTYNKTDLESLFFLDNQTRFEQCKVASEKLIFSQIQINLADAEKCEQLGKILDKNQAEISLINFTNIHDYIYNPHLVYSVSKLLKFTSDDVFIMYCPSCKNKTTLTKGITDYFENELHFQSITTEQEFN